MHLVLSPRRRLEQLYGPAYPAIAAALDSAIAARSAAGLVSLAYDPQVGLAHLGIGPSDLTPAALCAQLVAIERALALHDGIMVESLWIVGGPDALPFGSLPNPMRDHDGPILSDCVYGLADATNLLVRWPVGRTPDDRTDQGRLARLLSLIAAAHRSGRRPAGPTLGICAARWAAVSAEVFAAIGEPDANLLLAPPLQAGGLDTGRLAGASRIYCNLHGVTGSTTWYGQSPTDSELIPALRPADLAGLQLSGVVVITQACFGARLSTTEGEPTLALALLETGAALVGALGLSYGAPDPPPSESDLLAQQLLIALRQPDQRLGAAFQAAQAAVLRDVLRRQGSLDADDIKTLLAFVLYADPALAI